MIRTQTHKHMHKSTYARAHTLIQTRICTHTVARAEPKHLTKALLLIKRVRYLRLSIDKFSHFRTLHLAHFLFCSNSLNTHRKEELQQQHQQLQLQLASSFAFYMRNKNKTQRERAAREREHKRAQLTRRGDRLCYVFYCCFLSFFAVVIAPRPSLCTRQELNAI